MITRSNIPRKLTWNEWFCSGSSTSSSAAAGSPWKFPCEILSISSLCYPPQHPRIITRIHARPRTEESQDPVAQPSAEPAQYSPARSRRTSAGARVSHPHRAHRRARCAGTAGRAHARLTAQGRSCPYPAARRTCIVSKHSELWHVELLTHRRIGPLTLFFTSGFGTGVDFTRTSALLSSFSCTSVPASSCAGVSTSRWPSLSACSPLSRTTARYSIKRFLILSSP